MLDFQQKRKVRSIMYHRITLVVLGLLVLLFLHSTWSVYQKKEESQQLKDNALQRTNELQARNDELQANIERLNTDAGVEQEIRSKFSVAKPGENMVVVVPDNSPRASSTEDKTSWWQKIESWF